MLLNHSFVTTHTGGSTPILAIPETAPRAISESNIVTRINTNPLRSRDDMINLLFDILIPLGIGQSEGGARVVLGHSGAGFDPVAAELEGYARALWGLGPLLASEPDHPRFRSTKAAWVRGLVNGTDPDHEEYWGDCGNRDQRLVEQAAISVAIALAPGVFWNPLTIGEKDRVNNWLIQGNYLVYPASNWRFFRIINNVAMKLVGGQYDQAIIESELDFVEGFVGPHGMPSDGLKPDSKAFDYYASFAIHYYSLLLASSLEKDSPEIARRFRTRAAKSSLAIVNLFAPDGHSIPFGRSMTYRFATSAFWAACAFDGVELPAPLSLGVIKGLLLRNIRSFTRRKEVFNSDGTMGIGWTYPTLYMSENYNSPQSPYWTLKSFLVLALPASHPFWLAKEESYPTSLLIQPHVTVEPWSKVFSHAAGHTFLLTSGLLPNRPQRNDAAKYAKFAYSSSFGFSVPTGSYGLEQICPDSTLVLSDDPDKLSWKVRRVCEDVRINHNGVIRSTWRPWRDVMVTTWLVPPKTTSTPYHTRVHRIDSDRVLSTCEGGFAISSSSTDVESRPTSLPDLPLAGSAHGRLGTGSQAFVRSDGGVSGLISLYGSREGMILGVDSNSNLMCARTVLPTLQGTIGAGTTWMASRVFGVPSESAVGSEWLDHWKKESERVHSSLEDMLDELEVL